MAGPRLREGLSRPSMNTVRVMVPRDAFIAVAMMRNRKHGARTIGDLIIALVF